MAKKQTSRRAPARSTSGLRRPVEPAAVGAGTGTGAATLSDWRKGLLDWHGVDRPCVGSVKLDATLKAVGEGPVAVIVPSVVPWDGSGPAMRCATGRRVVGLGWRPDLPDRRDWRADMKGTIHDPRCGTAKAETKLQLRLRGRPASLPSRHVENVEFCSPVEDQEDLGSCTAQAVAGMMEYMMRRKGLQYVDMSRLFLYKVTRKLLGWTGDTGAYLRSTMQATVAFGVAPERYWPYDVSRFDEEPEAFLYSFAANYQALRYARLDPPGRGGRETLDLVRLLLCSGFVSVFGFSVYSSLQRGPDIPYPTDEDRLVGGHAVMAAGRPSDWSRSNPPSSRGLPPAPLLRQGFGGLRRDKTAWQAADPASAVRLGSPSKTVLRRSSGQVAGPATADRSLSAFGGLRSDLAGKIWQQNGATIGCRFGGWEKPRSHKFFVYKSLGAVCGLATGREGVANSCVCVAT